MSGTSETVVSSANAMVACAIPSFAPLRHSTSCSGSTSTRESPLHEGCDGLPKGLGASERRVSVCSRVVNAAAIASMIGGGVG